MKMKWTNGNGIRDAKWNVRVCVCLCLSLSLCALCWQTQTMNLPEMISCTTWWNTLSNGHYCAVWTMCVRRKPVSADTLMVLNVFRGHFVFSFWVVFIFRVPLFQYVTAMITPCTHICGARSRSGQISHGQNVHDAHHIDASYNTH